MVEPASFDRDDRSLSTGTLPSLHLPHARMEKPGKHRRRAAQPPILAGDRDDAIITDLHFGYFTHKLIRQTHLTPPESESGKLFPTIAVAQSSRGLSALQNTSVLTVLFGMPYRETTV